MLDRPSHCRLGVIADTGCVSERTQAVAAHRLAGVAPEHGGKLLAGDIAVGVLAIAHTVRHCPAASGFDPVRAGDAHAADAVTCVRRGGDGYNAAARGVREAGGNLLMR